MSRFVENAAKLLGAAESAMETGNVPSDLTILITPQGQIQMVADSDWPLDRLQAHHGAATAYRVSHRNERVQIEGREGVRTCRFQSDDPRRASRHLLGITTNYSVLALA